MEVREIIIEKLSTVANVSTHAGNCRGEFIFIDRIADIRVKRYTIIATYIFFRHRSQ